MPYKYALLCMHGMGDLDQAGFQNDVEKVKHALEDNMSTDDFSNVYIPKTGIFYSDETQNEEVKVWNAMSNAGGLNTGWIRENTINNLRRFVLYGFADATAFNGFASNANSQPYTLAQEIIRNALNDVYTHCGNVPVVLLSHSLGCQIMSNYLWDAQLYGRGLHNQIDVRSIWHSSHKPESNSNAELNAFLQLKSLKTWFTTGCNIPIFISGFKNVCAVHNREYGYNFDWLNYFDYDDVLGWPLCPLGTLFHQGNGPNAHGRSYNDVVTDIAVNAQDGILGAITSSWNPLAHTQYWGDDDILKAITKKLA